MTRHAIIALVVMLASGPAHATGGLLCRPIRGAGPSLSLVIGHGIPSLLVGVNVNDGKGWFSTMDKPQVIAISRNWIDEQIVWLDLVDVRTGARVVCLRATSDGKRSYAYSGTLSRRGRVTRVRCIEN